MSSLDKTEYLKALNNQREYLAAKIEYLESKLDDVDALIRQHTPPPDVTKMTTLERVAYEDGLRMRQHIIHKLTTEKSPFANVLDGSVFPKGL